MDSLKVESLIFLIGKDAVDELIDIGCISLVNGYILLNNDFSLDEIMM